MKMTVSAWLRVTNFWTGFGGFPGGKAMSAQGFPQMALTDGRGARPLVARLCNRFGAEPGSCSRVIGGGDAAEPTKKGHAKRRAPIATRTGVVQDWARLRST